MSRGLTAAHDDGADACRESRGDLPEPYGAF